MTAAGAPLALGPVTLRNRLVATAHASGLVADGLPVAGDAEYWGRLAAGGAAMLIGGGTVTAPESAPRRGNIVAAWRPEVVEPLRRRVQAIHAHGAVAVWQLAHLGRETLGADTYFSPVAPSAVRSPREPTAPRALRPEEVAPIVEGFGVAASHARQAGFDGIELHAAHGYLLEQFLSPRTNDRGDGLAVLTQVAEAVRAAAPGVLLGVRLSVDGAEAVGLTDAELAELLPAVDALADWVNLTVGVRTTYVRDMATVRPPVLDDLARLRPLVGGTLLVSHAFRAPEAIAEALAAGADLVGMARPLIADPDLPRKLLAGRAAEIRPCVACNEDCRTFDPLLLCSVNPDLAPPGQARRPAAPLVLRRAPDRRAPGRVAVAGAGPAGLECALTLARRGAEVVLFEAADALGGQLATAAAAPHRSGWASLLAFYAHGLATAGVDVRVGTPAEDLDGFGAVVWATGAEELVAPAGAERSSSVIAAGPAALAGARHVAVVDDGFGWWPGCNVVELALAAGVPRVTYLTPGTAFAGGIPAESRVQLLQRLNGAGRLEVVALAAPDRARTIGADRVVAVGERRPRALPECAAPLVLAVGDAIVPRRAAHAIAEGRAAGEQVADALSGAGHAVAHVVV